MSDIATTAQTANLARKPGDHGFEAVHQDEREWQKPRFANAETKMLFHPRPERPTEPNAGFVRYAPGASHPMHRHDFAQIWYLLEGEFKIRGKVYKPGTMIFHPDPHYEDELTTETGGVWLYVQYPGPTTGKPPIFDGRFNRAAPEALEEQRLDI